MTLWSFGTSFYLYNGGVDSNYLDMFSVHCLEKIEDCTLVINFNHDDIPDVQAHDFAFQRYRIAIPVDASQPLLIMILQPDDEA